MKTRSIAIALGAAMLLVVAQPITYAQTVTTYTTASAWQAAVQGSSQFSEDFSGYTKDTYFQSAPVKAGPFSLQQVGSDRTFGLFRNLIDFPPLQFTDNSGVTYAALYTKSGLVTVDMKFASTIYAWGANFYGSEASELETLLLKDASGNTVATVPVTVDTGFFGFVLSPATPISTITFQSRIDNPAPSIGQGFGLENVVGACNATCVQPELVFNPASVNFGNVNVGSVSASKLVTITNNTSSAAAYVSSTGLAEFAFSGGTCGTSFPSITLAAGASCTVNADFAPTTAGAASGSIVFSSSAGQVSFDLTGTGVAVSGTLTFTPASVSFGNVPNGTKSASQTVTITNNTNATATYAGMSSLSEFGFSGGTCLVKGKTSIAAGASCTFDVYFAPTKSGAVTGSFSGNTSAGVVTFTMTGTGVPATLVFSPPSVSFGDVPVGTKSASQTVTITNNTNATATYAGMSSLSEFGFSGGTCLVKGRTSIAAGASCTFDVYFAPTKTGAVTGSFSGNTSAGVVTFTMSGTGVTNEAKVESSSPPGIERPESDLWMADGDSRLLATANRESLPDSFDQQFAPTVRMARDVQTDQKSGSR